MGPRLYRTLFENLQKAYYYKTTGSATKAPAAGTAWHTTLAVHGLLSTSSLPQKTGFMSLARLLVPFWASEALACSTVNLSGHPGYGLCQRGYHRRQIQHYQQ